MKILLRRASSLARACGREAQTLIEEVQQESDLRFSAHSFTDDAEIEETVKRRMHTASEKTVRQLEDALDLYRAQSKIRAMIGSANTEAVSPLLAEREHYLKAAERALKTTLDLGRLDIRGRDIEHNATEVAAQLTGIRRRLAASGERVVTDSVRVAKLSSHDVTKLRDRLSEVQRRQIELSEELAKANLGVSITLPDDIVTILRKHKIIT